MISDDTGEERRPRDPGIKVTESARYFLISAMLPEVTEEQIRIDLEHASLTIAIPGEGEIVRKVVSIPGGSRIIHKKFSRGMLEITLERPSTGPG